MQITETAKSRAREFVENETQFHLGFLPTEQSNPITATLEDDFRRSTLDGVRCLQRGDRQVPIVMRHVLGGELFRALVDAMAGAMRTPTGRVIFSGCGATGRLSILLESMWRDFFRRRRRELSEDEAALANRAASIMTGGDFALIKSVESFEDFSSVGERQAAALRVGKDDVFVAITEGGETSSVLGSLGYAAEAGARCFLVFNNPARVLRERLERSRKAIDDPRVTVIDLYCGQMSLAGSTRMQATTSEQLLCSCALEAALCELMPRFAAEAAANPAEAFEALLSGLEAPSARAGIAETIDYEKGVYSSGGRITYLADDCMLDVFTDNTERSPTFMLPQLKSSLEKALPQSWAFVKNPLHTTPDCWLSMLGRRPRCLDFSRDDAIALGMPARIADNPPRIGEEDLMRYMIGNEPSPERIDGYERAAAVTVTVRDIHERFMEAAASIAKAWPERTGLHIGTSPTDGIRIVAEIASSPLETWKRLAAKLALNCISTGTMVAMGRVAGNWMSWVSISNKKLIDRGVRLLSELGGVSYREAADRLFAAEEWISSQDWTDAECPCAVQMALNALRGNH